MDTLHRGDKDDDDDDDDDDDNNNRVHTIKVQCTKLKTSAVI